MSKFTPLPPPVLREDITTVELMSNATNPSLTSVFSVSDIEPAAGTMGIVNVPNDIQSSFEVQKVPSGCRMKHRFDRKALIAYEWGDNRLAFDVDGVGLTSYEVDAIKFKYRFRFSPDSKKPYKTKREKCRYQSGWQGMIGSGYNEFFLRENDTVVQGARKFVNELDDSFDKSF